jgi:methylated-DNA-[protein]-cysteine S-methyltransferase
MISTFIESPVGPLTLAGPSEHVLSRLSFGHVGGCGEPVDDAYGPVRAQLDEYFTGARSTFDVELALEGTNWETRVWSQLRAIPYGQTRSYGQIAALACAPERTGAHSARAVGRANHHNPVAIIVPCHRVIGADGKLVGFGGGLDTKRRLLDLEAGRLALV